MLSKEVLAERSRAERFFREANRNKVELECSAQAQRVLLQENSALIAENVQLKISIENMSRLTSPRQEQKP